MDHETATVLIVGVVAFAVVALHWINARYGNPESEEARERQE